MTDTVPRITRRSALKPLALSVVAQAGAQAASMPRAAAARDGASRSGTGIVVYDSAIRRKRMRRQDATFDLFEPLTFLKHCGELGAGGMQAPLGVLPPDRVRALRDDAERRELFVEAIVDPPASESDVARFETEVKTAAEVGAPAARTVVVPGRR